MVGILISVVSVLSIANAGLAYFNYKGMKSVGSRVESEFESVKKELEQSVEKRVCSVCHRVVSALDETHTCLTCLRKKK